jgi:hypothetical protein
MQRVEIIIEAAVDEGDAMKELRPSSGGVRRWRIRG